MSFYTPAITVYAIVLTILFCRQQLRTHNTLLDIMALSASCKTIADLAHDAKCTKLRAWMFLVVLRVRRCIKVTALAQRDFINIYGYELNPKGRGKYRLTC